MKFGLLSDQLVVNAANILSGHHSVNNIVCYTNGNFSFETECLNEVIDWLETNHDLHLLRNGSNYMFATRILEEDNVVIDKVVDELKDAKKPTTNSNKEKKEDKEKEAAGVVVDAMDAASKNKKIDDKTKSILKQAIQIASNDKSVAADIARIGEKLAKKIK